MSTSAMIALSTSNGYIATTVHWDGGVVGETLAEHYTDMQAITSLINQGEIRTLWNTVEETETYSDSTPPFTAREFVELMQDARSLGVDYVYIHPGVEDGNWMSAEPHGAGLELM